MSKELLSLEATNKHQDYYHKILEPIFFELLNKLIKSRMEEYSGKLYSLIPYLNGGLFTPHDDDFYKRKNGEQSIYHNTLKVPDKWFKDLFETLELYNFTIDENSSFDEELSIDPEMLGRIFENLLAEINPETGESARKSTGSYYTPRSIVDYMVDESLFHYLKQKTNIEENQLRAVISYDLSDETLYPLDKDDKQKIVDALEELKLLDPACGSGAFPIGALQKIVFILQQVDPEGQLWFEKQIKTTSPEIRRVIEREFSHKNFDYIRKLGIIRENIFGIDIQPIATEISRLRCFLTMVVDERVDDSLENRGIEPLPNLDFKFVTANSLIGLPDIDGAGQTEMFDDREKIDALKEIRNQYFNASGIEREQLKTQFIITQKKLVDQLIKEHGYIGLAKAELTQKLSGWEPFSNIASSWFDPKWMFGVDEGFDIVMGNPPYISIANLPKRYSSDLNAQKYETFSKGADIYCLFYESGIKHLRHNGVLSYISSNRFCFTNYGVGLRKYLSKNNILELINFNEINVFESANVGSIVTVIQNSSPDENPILILEAKGEEPIIRIQTEKKYSSKEYYKETRWSFGEDCSHQLKKKIESKGTPFIKRKGVSINRGITTGLNAVFIIQEKLRNELIKADPKSKEILLPVLKGANIKRYFITTPKQYLIYAYTGIQIEKYPAIFNYLKRYKNELAEVYEAKNGQKKWYELRNCSYYDKFLEKKLVWTRLSNINAFSISKAGEFAVDSSSFAVSNDIEYLAAILNSKVVFFYFKLGSVIWGKDGIKWFGEHFDNIPIPNISKLEQLPFETVVNYVISIKINLKDPFFFESLIDAMVYELFFPDEIKAADAEVLKYLNKLPELKDAWSDEKKLVIIDKTYKELSNPKHAVSIAMERMKAVPEVRIIEGLDK
jgi:hypothetical protein